MRAILLTGMIMGVAGTLPVSAGSQTFTAGIRFIEPLTFQAATNPSFGNLEAGTPGRHFVLGTDGSVSGADAGAYAGGAQPGSLKIHGSAFQNINIVAQNIVDDGGVSVSSIICNYGGAGNVDCAAGISGAAAPTTAGTTLLLGLDINTTSAHADGDTAAPAFDIVVTYN